MPKAYPVPGETAAPHPDQPPVKPGKTVDIVLRDYDGLREFLRQTNFPGSITNIVISVGDVVFDDGTKWSAGGVFLRDVVNPNKWNRVKESAATV